MLGVPFQWKGQMGPIQGSPVPPKWVLRCRCGRFGPSTRAEAAGLYQGRRTAHGWWNRGAPSRSRFQPWTGAGPGVSVRYRRFHGLGRARNGPDSPGWSEGTAREYGVPGRHSAWNVPIRAVVRHRCAHLPLGNADALESPTGVNPHCSFQPWCARLPWNLENARACAKAGWPVRCSPSETIRPMGGLRRLAGPPAEYNSRCNGPGGLQPLALTGEQAGTKVFLPWDPVVSDKRPGFAVAGRDRDRGWTLPELVQKP